MRDLETFQLISILTVLIISHVKTGKHLPTRRTWCWTRNREMWQFRILAREPPRLIFNFDIDDMSSALNEEDTFIQRVYINSEIVSLLTWGEKNKSVVLDFKTTSPPSFLATSVWRKITIRRRENADEPRQERNANREMNSWWRRRRDAGRVILD